MVVDSEHSSTDKAEESFDCVRCDVTPVLMARVFAFLVSDNIVIGKVIVNPVIDGRFVGLNPGAHFNVLFHNGLDVF